MVKGSDILLVIVAIIFPPAAAAFITGCSSDLLISVALTILGYLPGHLHAFWLIYKKIQAEESFGPEGYTYLGNGHFAGNGAPTGAQQGQQQPYYGSTQ